MGRNARVYHGVVYIIISFKLNMDPENEFIKETREKLVLKENEILNTARTDFPGNYYGYDDTWTLEKFKSQLKVNVISLNKLDMEFDIIGVDPSIPNALRRILISEVPTMAFDKVFLFNNTSIIQDEVLTHRLGLIPLKADPRMFEFRQEGDLEGTPEDTLEFELKIKCSWNPQRTKEHVNPEDLYRDFRVFTSHLKWNPLGNQNQLYSAEAVGPVENDILLAKLRPGHEIDMKLHAVKSVGRDHAKFSPVATAFYRLLPEVTINRTITGEPAERLQQCFSPGVIDLVDDPSGKKKAVVNNARYDMCSRNAFRYEDLKDSVKLTRVRDHFIFYIESTGALTPDILLVEAAKILSLKCQNFLSLLETEL